MTRNMRRSTDRILVSHAGTVPRPVAFQEVYAAGDSRRDEYLRELPSAVRDVVQHQARIGIDVVNDGELSKRNFSHYAQARLGGISQTTTPPPGERNIVARDAVDFPDFHRRGGGRLWRAATASQTPSPTGNVNPTLVCSGPLTYVGREATELDIANLKGRLDGLG